MSTTYEWMKFVEYPLTTPDTSGGVNVPFASYFTDFGHGVRTSIDPMPTAVGVYYYWRLRIAVDDVTLFDIEWRFCRPTSTTEELYACVYREGETPFWVDRSYFLGSTYTSSLTIDSITGNFLPGTTVVTYETSTSTSASGSRTVTGGDIDSDTLGIGYDLRALSIENFRPIEPITNLTDPENNEVNFKGDLYALPKTSAIYPSGWAPTTLQFSIEVGGGHTSVIEDEYITVAASSSGYIGEVDLSTLFVPRLWNGKDNYGLPLKGLHDVHIYVKGKNPDGHSLSYSYAYGDTLAYVYECECSSCQNGMCYNSRFSQRGSQSFGYGWSSEGSMRCFEQDDQLFLKTESGNYMRWTVDGSNFVPFNPATANDIQVEKDSGIYRFTFKDQSVLRFDEITGRPLYRTDRNENVLYYNFDSSDRLIYVGDGNGRFFIYDYYGRSDGQPSFRVEGNPNNTTARNSASYGYYDDTDPVCPNRLRYVLDAEGNTTYYQYYTDGRLFAISYPQGNFVAYDYDEWGRLAEEQTDHMSRYYQYALEDDGRTYVAIIENSFTEPSYRRRDLTLDRYGRTVIVGEQVDAFNNSRYTSYYYPEIGFPLDPNLYLATSVSDNNSNTVSMTYTPEGNLKTMTDKAGYVTTYTYADEIDYPLNLKHRNLVREIQRPSVTVDGDLVTYDPTIFEYDANGNLERVTDAKSGVTEMTYDTDGLVLTVTNRNGHTTEFVYNGDPFNYESRNLLQIRTPKGDSTLDGFRTVTFEYDDYDNVVSVKDDLNNELVTTYDDLDRPLTVTDPLGQVASFVYEDALLKDVLLPPNNGSSALPRKTSMLYEDSGRLQEVRRDIDDVGTQQMRVKYSYTGYSQLAALTRLKNGSDQSFTFTYDQVGRTVAVADPLATAGVTTTAYEPFCVGQATTSARGVRRKTSFDSRCLLTQVALGNVDPSDPLEVLNARELREWDHDELGRMVKSSQTRSPRYNQAVMGIDLYGGQPEERLYLFDELDRLVEMRFRTDGDPLGADDKVMAWEYDPEGNVTKVTDTEGKVTRYTYFRDNLLKEVIVERTGDPDRVFAYSYDLAGRLLEIEYPAETEVVAKFDDGTSTPGSGWDAKGQLLHLRYEKDGDLIRRLEFSYDASGNRASLLDVTNGTVLTAKAIKWEFGYDWLDRLVTVNRSEASTVGGLPSTIAPFSSFTFDASDNRITYTDFTGVDPKVYRYVMDDADNLTEIYLTEGSDPEILLETIESDPDGNMLTRTNEITDEVITYQWDDADRLTQVSSAIGGVKTSTMKEHNRYDVAGIRKRKLGKNGNTAEEYTAGISTTASKALTSSSTAPTISYVAGHQILGCECEGVFQFWLPDFLGSVREVVDDTGTVIRSMEFDVHGQLLSSSGTGTFAPKTYQGALSVNDDTADSGLYLMGHRHFQPMLGRFLNRDPIGFRGGLNLFSGSGVSPVTFVDYKGTSMERVNELISHLRTRKYSEKCKKAVDRLRNDFCPGGSDVRTDVPSENVLDTILGLDRNVRLDYQDPGATDFSGWTTNNPDNTSDMIFKGPMGKLGSPFSEEELETGFHEILHLTGVLHPGMGAWTQPFAEGEAFAVHVLRICLGTSGKTGYQDYWGQKAYWAVMDENNRPTSKCNGLPKLKRALEDFPLP